MIYAATIEYAPGEYKHLVIEGTPGSQRGFIKRMTARDPDHPGAGLVIAECMTSEIAQRIADRIGDITDLDLSRPRWNEQ